MENYLFRQTKMKHLGFQVTQRVIITLNRKVEVIVKIMSLKNKLKKQAFI